MLKQPRFQLRNTRTGLEVSIILGGRARRGARSIDYCLEDVRLSCPIVLRNPRHLYRGARVPTKGCVLVMAKRVEPQQSRDESDGFSGCGDRT